LKIWRKRELRWWKKGGNEEDGDRGAGEIEVDYCMIVKNYGL
jgi:hypothetical protein